MEAGETSQIERYLRAKFNNTTIGARPRSDDVAESSAEISMDGEFIGVVFKDTEDGDTCYHFQMTILSEDIE
ncbi:MAG: DUF3126 family protein [Candidatus Puniceispirillales bacterium]